MTIRIKISAVFLILLAYSLMVSSALKKSATVDEQSHLFRGFAYLKTGATQFLLGHPILGSALSALPLLTEENLQLPTADPAWEAGNWSIAGDLFMWQLNDNPGRLLFLGRLPVIWLTLLLGALAFRWARELKGAKAGLLAITFLLMNPNILAHGRLITGDLPLTCFYLLTIYGFWRWYKNQQDQKSTTISILIAGLGLGLAGATKFNGALLAPTLGLLALGLAYSRRSLRPLLTAVSIGLLAWVVIWTIYRLDLTPLPGGAFWDDLFWEFQYFEKPHGAWLAGQSSPTGWWYYFPITFLIKTPIPILLGLLLMAWLALKAIRAKAYRPILPDTAFLALPPLLYMAISMTGSLNIGYRHLSPILPFVAIGLALTLASLKINKIFFWVLPVWLVIISLFAWPDYIPYFNLLAGGSNNGWKILSDSNVDWGQDLPALAAWQQENGRPIKLSYFGTAHPSAYNLDFEPLPTWAPGPEKALPGRQVFYPPDPAPGWYAISVTNLHGVVLGAGKQDTFAWFREREPQDRIGNSIYLYEVPARGETADVAFSNLEPADISPELFSQFTTNDLRPRWFDGSTSLIVPLNGGWLVVPPTQSIDQSLAGFWPDTPLAQSPNAQLFFLNSLDLSAFSGQPQDLGETIRFQGYQLITAENEIVLQTAWLVRQETNQPLKIFVHALDDSGQIASQWDGLDIDPLSWRAGDTIIQLHHLPRPAGSWQITTGIYDSQTLDRLGQPINLFDQSLRLP